MRAPARMPPRKCSAPGASRRGGIAQQPKHPNRPSLRSAQYVQALCAVHRGPSAAMARALGFPSGRAEKRRARGGRVPKDTRLRQLTRCGCLSGARQRAASSAARPANEHRRLPRRAAAGSRPAGSPFLWFLSFGEAKERDSPAGATSRPPPSEQASKHPSKQASTQARKHASTQARKHANAPK